MCNLKVKICTSYYNIHNVIKIFKICNLSSKVINNKLIKKKNHMELKNTKLLLNYYSY